MFEKATPKFAENEMVRLRHRTAAYVGKVFGYFSKGHEFRVVGYFVDMTATEYRNYDDPKNMEESFEIPVPEYVYELRDEDGQVLKAYESDLKRAKRRVEAAVEPEVDQRPLAKLVHIRNS